MWFLIMPDSDRYRPEADIYFDHFDSRLAAIELASRGAGPLR
jgi:hypothetical protein